MAPVIDIAASSDIAATGEVARAPQTLLRLAYTLGERAVLVPFGDDELCVTLSGLSMEDTYELAQRMLRHLAEGLKGLWLHAGVVGYPEHGSDAGEVGAAAFKALKTAKRFGDNGIVLVHKRTRGSV